MSRAVFNECLIAEVERRPRLWNTRLQDYRNAALRDSLWMEVAASLQGLEPGVTPDKVFQRWRNLRDTYRKKRREKKAAGKSGSQSDPQKTKKQWPYFTLLDFLKDTMEERLTASNLSDSEEEDQPMHSPEEHTSTDTASPSEIMASTALFHPAGPPESTLVFGTASLAEDLTSTPQCSTSSSPVLSTVSRRLEEDAASSSAPEVALERPPMKRPLDTPARRAARAKALLRKYRDEDGAVYVDAAWSRSRPNIFAAVAVTAATGELKTACSVCVRGASQAEEVAIALALSAPGVHTILSDSKTAIRNFARGAVSFLRLWDVPLEALKRSGVSSIPVAPGPVGGGAIRLKNPELTQAALRAPTERFGMTIEVPPFGRGGILCNPQTSPV
ncbi:uncharacterized protein LOC144175682 [Haemaphysalis longicornis]